MTDAEREALRWAVAEAIWQAGMEPHFTLSDTMEPVQQLFLARADAALAVAEPVVREDEREACIRTMKRRWKGGYPGEVIADLEAVIRARGAA